MYICKKNMSNKNRIRRKINQIKRDLMLKRLRKYLKEVNCKIKYINLEGSFEDAQKIFEY